MKTVHKNWYWIRTHEIIWSSFLFINFVKSEIGPDN